MEERGQNPVKFCACPQDPFAARRNCPHTARMSNETRAYDPATDDTPADVTRPWGSYAPTALQRMLIGLTRRTFLQRGNLRRIMSKWIVSIAHPLDITFRGCGFRIDGRNNLIEWGLLTRPSYNATELDFLCGVMDDPAAVGVDIGCNIGLYTLPMAKTGGRVIAIDANDKMIERLNFNTQATELTNVTPVCTAVGDHDGQVDLHIRRDDVAIVNVVESDAGSIPMRTLAGVLAEAGVTRVDALKIDIEGHEDAALVPFLDGATQAMRPKRIVIEWVDASGDYPGCAAAFKRHGYRLITRTRNNSLYQLD